MLFNKMITLHCRGYWRDIHSDNLLDESGIYIVYVCTFNQQSNSVTLHRIIYIGESENIKTRVQNHNLKPCWLNQIGTGEELCYAFALCNENDRVIVEATLINQIKPVCNTNMSFYIPSKEFSILIEGEHALLLHTYFSL